MEAKEEQDVFWGRCAPENKFGSFNGEPSVWCDNGTCSYCGSAKPSVALDLIKQGARVTPTDKNYKMYVEGLTNPGQKCYFNHFSESQAVELVVLWKQGKINFAYSGSFYSGLCFGIYKDAIEKALAELNK
jgi:hypothetical protein